MKQECYVIRETDPKMRERIGRDSYFVGHDHVVVFDIMQAKKFATIEAAKKFNGIPDNVPYEIIPVTVEYEVHEDKIERVEVEREDDEL